MRRWLFAVGTLLLGAVTSAQADYVLIEYTLGASKNQGNQQMAGMPGMMGMRGMMGAQGMGPMGPGMGPGGNMAQMMQQNMQRMSGMMRGGPPGGGRMAPGAAGAPAPGGVAPGGLGGRNPGLFPGGLAGQQPTTTDDDEESVLKVSAVIEVKKWSTMPFRSSTPNVGVNPGGLGGAGRGGFPGNPTGFGGAQGGYGGAPGGLAMNRGTMNRDTFEAFTHDLVQGGKTGLYPGPKETSADIYWEPIKEKTVDQKYKARRDEMLKDTQKSAASYQDLAKWVLNNGKVNEFPNIMEEWEKIDADSPQVLAYKKIKAAISRPVSKDDPSLEFWRNKLSDYRPKQDSEKYPHFTLLYSSAKNVLDSTDINNRMKRLEDNFKAFYYWFALQGKELPVPDYRLIAVLVDKPSEFEVYRKVFDNVPLSDDGFYARRENLAFFSATPLDEKYDALDASMKDLWGKGWNKEELLKGKGAPRSSSSDSVEVIRNQVKVALLKALQDESELTAATHEGTLQLGSVTGLLPRTVAVPEWAEFGFASFFETSKGAWWPSTGAPNHQYLTKFQKRGEKWQEKKLPDGPPDKALTLKKIITDQYFREARFSNQSADWIKARTLAWALTYYLMETKFEGLMNYYQELSNLPRDMEFDQEILLGCFVRAFKLDSPDNPGVAKPEALQKLAQDWLAYMPNVQDQYAVTQKYEDQPAKKSRGGAKKGQ
jgi:hypothetical protein